MNFIKIFIIIFLLYSSYSYSQTFEKLPDYSLTEKTKVTDKISHPVFIPHIGVGLASGVRLGIWSQINENLTAEISAGYDLANFVSASDKEYRYGLGVSYIFDKDVPVFVNGLFSLGERAEGNLRSPKYYYSLNVGYISLARESVFFFARGGVIFKYYYERAEEKVHYDVTYPNLDVGIGYTF
jgi:hypothetical protein